MTDIIFLDGGLGQEIHHRSSNPSAHPLWSLQVMYDEPELVTQVHYDFIKAGSKVLSLNNYTATPQRLQKYGNPEQFSNSHELAASVLSQAIKQANINRSDIDIAGSLPPLVASYVASEALDFETSVQHYRALIAAQKPYIDLFLIETMSNISEAKAAITALTEFKEHALVGMTICDDFSNTLRSGEALELAVEEILATGASALMLNCSYPEAIDNALPILAAAGVPFGAYANGFTSIKALTPGATVDNLTGRRDLSKKKYAKHVHKWLDLGATIIGGCCEIGPEYIRYLRNELENNGHHLVSARQSGIITGTINS